MKRAVWKMLVLLAVVGALAGCGPSNGEDRLLTWTYYSGDGTVYWVCTYFYDEAGQCVREETRRETEDQGEWGQNVFKTYNAQGQLLTSAMTEVTDGLESEISQESYEYDEEGRLAKYHGDWNGQPHFDELYSYDAQGRKEKTEISFYRVNDNRVENQTILYFYDGQDRLISQEERWEWVSAAQTQQQPLDNASEVIASGQNTSTYTYDEDGRLLHEKSDRYDSWEQTYTYDAAGRLIKTQDTSGNATEYEYDSKGNRIEERTYLNSFQGKLSFYSIYTYGPMKTK